MISTISVIIVSIKIFPMKKMKKTMLIKFVESTYMMPIKELICNATYQLPRVGEYVSFNCKLFEVKSIKHNLDHLTVTVLLEPK